MSQSDAKWAEEDWERRAPYRAVEAAELAEICAQFGTVSSTTLLEAGKSNSNYRVAFADHPDLVVRLYDRDATAMERERRVLELVDGRVPTPTWVADGQLEDATPYALMEFLVGVKPHVALSTGVDALEMGRNLGRTLTALQDITFERAGLLAPDLTLSREFDSVAHSFRDLIEYSLDEGRCGKRLGKDLAAALKAFIPQACERLGGLDEAYSLCHGDYKFSNLLIDPATAEVAGVLDWEFAFPFAPIFDVAILMRHRDGFPTDLIRGFELGARSAGWALPEDWRELTRILDLMNLCGFLNASGDRPRLYESVRALIAETLGLDLDPQG